MTDNDDPNDVSTETELVSTAAVTSTYKILGEFEAGNDPAILGQNNANAGTPIGVQGAVPQNASGYGLYTDANAYVGSALDAGSVSFTDSNSDGDRFSITEEGGDGNLEVSYSGTATHEFGTGGELNIKSELTENTSL